MDTKTFVKIVAYIGVTIGLFWSVLQGKLSFANLAIIVVLVVVLHWAIPSRFDRNFGTFEILFFWVGFPLAMVTENTLGEVPMWIVWTWLGLSLIVSVFFPFPYFRFFRKYSPNSFH